MLLSSLHYDQVRLFLVLILVFRVLWILGAHMHLQKKPKVTNPQASSISTTSESSTDPAVAFEVSSKSYRIVPEATELMLTSV